MFDLKGFRKERKLSQKQISEILGIGTSFISQIETGKDPMPSYIPDKLADAFGKEEVEKYHREPQYELEAERFLRKRYLFPTSTYMPSRRAFADDSADAMLDGPMPGKMNDRLIERVLAAFERRDELALLQQKEYERQGSRIDEILAFLKDQG